MNADPDKHELFPDVNAAGALRAGFQRRNRSSAEGTRASPNVARDSASGTDGYELQGEIARGGMGVIVKAHDRELGRDVALKVLRDELAGEPKLVRRFLEEARITARLDHPGIVPVHEVGRDEAGRAYFAMRLVRGRELKRIIELAHADGEGWNQTRALSVIQKVCEAMAYAHEKGVIHRDLKPSNVMVGEFGEVYVMDWGLARLIGADDTHDLRLRDGPRIAPVASGSSAVVSRAGRTAMAVDVESPIVTLDGEVLGTPCYMSPEQAQGRIAELGPRSDVYSVGAMLYHLLAGEMPYVPAGTSVPSRTVLVHLVQGPPRPLHELRTDVPSELIAISEKAMARDPVDRYPNMLAMAEDLRAFLERRVVRAYETGAWAEARKWVQRNRALSGAMSLAVVALVAGLLVSLALKSKSDANYLRAENSARAANDERDRALKIATFLEDTLHGVAPSVALGRDTAMLREMMDTAWSRVEKGDLAAAPEAELRLMLVIGETYDDIDQYEKAESVLKEAVTKAQAIYPADHALLARGLSQLGEVLRERGDSAAAEPISRRGLEMRQRLFPGDHADVAESLEKLSGVLEDAGDLAGAEALSRRAFEMRQRLFKGDHATLALAANNLGARLHQQGDLSGAEPLFRQAMEMQERLFRGDHPALATSIDNLAGLLGDRGDRQQSEALHRRALEMRRRLFAGDHSDVAMSLNNLARALADRGDTAEAELLLRESLEMRRRLFKGDHLNLAWTMGNLGALVHKRGDLAAAEALYRDSLDMLRRLFPGDHPTVATQLSNLAVLLKVRGDLEEAEPLYREALAMVRRLYAGDHLNLVISLNNLASLLEIRGDVHGAEPFFREALDMQLRLAPGDDAAVAKVEANLVNLLRRAGDPAGAELLHREVLERRQRQTQAQDPDPAATSIALASVLADQGDANGAEAFYREALRSYRALAPASDPRFAGTQASLGAWLGRRKRFAEADALFVDAVRGLAETRKAHPSEYAQCVRAALANAAAWTEAEPGDGPAQRASEWKQRLSEVEHE